MNISVRIGNNSNNYFLVFFNLLIIPQELPIIQLIISCNLQLYTYFETSRWYFTTFE